MKGLVVDGAAVVCRPGMVQFAVESSAASWTPWSGLDYVALDLNVFFILVGCKGVFVPFSFPLWLHCSGNPEMLN